MSIQDDIKRLEEELALKKAYMSVGFTFNIEEENFSKEIIEKVTSSLKECAEKLAAGEPINNKETDFSDQEIKALKALASTVITKSAAGSVKSTNPSKPSEPRNNLQSIIDSSNDSLVGKIGQLTMLDSVPLEQRKKVKPEALVEIRSVRRDKVYVTDEQNNSFWMPLADLDLNYNQGEASNE